MLESGLYEQVMNEKTAELLEKITHQQAEIQDIDRAEASKILAQYITSGRARIGGFSRPWR